MAGRNRRGPRNQVVEPDASVVVVEEHEESCIDLTVDDHDQEVIDLSSPMEADEADGVVETPASDTQRTPRRRTTSRRSRGGVRRRRGPGRRGVSRSGTQSLDQPAVQVVDDSDSDLPDVDLGSSTPYERSAASNAMGPFSPVHITCPICLEDANRIKASGKSLMSTVCGHVFCSECIKETLNQPGPSRICPTCRSKLTKKQVHRLYI